MLAIAKTVGRTGNGEANMSLWRVLLPDFHSTGHVSFPEAINNVLLLQLVRSSMPSRPYGEFVWQRAQWGKRWPKMLPGTTQSTQKVLQSYLVLAL